MEIEVFNHSERPQVTVVRPHGKVDASNYTELIERGRRLVSEGAGHVALDLSDVAFMSSAGLMAVHILALLLRGEKLPESESGRTALRSMPGDYAAGVQKHLKLCGLQPGVAETFEKAGFTRFLPLFPDLQSAVDAFE